MADHSILDSMYFIDEHIFNCPFCNRRHVSYHVESQRGFNWSETKDCYVYIVVCRSCEKKSMHLSFEEVPLISGGRSGVNYFSLDEDENLDDKFFYSVPTSFFTLDDRIPRQARDLFVEAEGCLKSNFLTGASACVRKLIYEVAVIEGANGANYEDRLRSIKEKRTDVEPEYFDTMLTIQQITSDKVHENSLDGWEVKHLKGILSTVQEILMLMYVIPEMRKEKRQAILDLKRALTGGE